MTGATENTDSSQDRVELQDLPADTPSDHKQAIVERNLVQDLFQLRDNCTEIIEASEKIIESIEALIEHDSEGPSEEITGLLENHKQEIEVYHTRRRFYADAAALIGSGEYEQSDVELILDMVDEHK